MFIKGSEELFRNINLDFKIDDEFDVVLRKQAFILQIAGLRKAECLSSDEYVIEAEGIRNNIGNKIYPNEIFPTGDGYKPTQYDMRLLDSQIKQEPILEDEMVQNRASEVSPNKFAS